MNGSTRCAILRFSAGILAACFFLGSAPAQVSASGYEFDGIGARAVARGGAVIADATDWTAIYWNPANLPGAARQAGLELRAGNMISHDGNSFNSPVAQIPIPGLSADKFSKTRNSPSFVLGSAGGVVPLNPRSAIGFGVYVPIMQGVKFKDTDNLGKYNKFKADGYAALAVTNVSYASQFADKFSAGAGLDVIYAKLKSKTVSDFASNPLISAPDVVESKLDGHGVGLEGVFGLKYKQNDELAYGLVFRTGSKFDIKGDASFHSAAGIPAESSDFTLHFKHPPTSGAGAAWKAKRNLTLTGDITQTWWKGFSNKTSYDTPGQILADTGNTYKWVNSVKFRAGALWNYDERTDFMFGYAFDTPAIDKNSLDFSTAIDVPMHRFSAAATRKYGAFDWTLGALAGGGSRTAGGVHYSVKGWYVMSEVSYRF